MQGADTSQLPGGPPAQQHAVLANGYAGPAGDPASLPAHGYRHDASQWQAHDPAWQHYYQQQQLTQAQQHGAQPPQPQPQQPAAAGSAGQDGAAWQPQLQRPTDWPQAQQSTDAGSQPNESGPTPPLPEEPPVPPADQPPPPADQPPLPDAAHPPPGQPQAQWPQPAATPPPDAVQQQQWPQQQWTTPPQQHWPADPQQQYWQQQGLQQQPTWDANQAMYAQNGAYAAQNGAYQYPQYQQWPQTYQQPAAYPQAYQQHQQYAAYGAWPAASAPYGAAQPPQQQQVPLSAPAAWQPVASAAVTQYAPAIPSAAPAQPKAQQLMPPRVATAAELFWPPGRANRPSRIVVLLRGPPGSGKSAAARRVRQLEQDAGESVRVHSIDDYFVVEVEREVDDEKRAGRKRKITEMEYLYEAELEDSYEASLLKAFTKTVDEGKFKCVLVDAPLLAAAQLRDYWRIGQKAGYEVFIGQPLELDPQVCHKRNVHKRTLEDIRRAIAALEQPQPSFPQLDLSGVFGPPPSAEQPAEDATGQPSGPATQEQQQHQQPALLPGAHSIDEVDMEAESDEERTPASRAPGGSRKRSSSSSSRGGSSSDDDDQAALLGGATTRWGSLGDADEEVTPQKKKRKQDAAAAAAEEDDEAFRTPAPTKRKTPLRGILSTGGGGSAQRVRWADEGEHEAAGFSVGGASREQLETVFVLEGLGPPMDDEQRQALGQKSFEDQVKGEHHSEHQLFRDHMLGGRR